MKAITSIVALFILTAFAPLSGFNAFAADKPGEKKENKAEAREKFRPFRGTIKAVDNTGKTITLEGEKAQMFAITSDTKINKDGKPAAFADLTVGETVGGRAKETADGKWAAVTINAGKRASARPADKEKK
jgi:uncharacterized lipoprotein NlpE involved in copper resistance